MLGQPQPPADLRPNPYLPGGPEPLIWEDFGGINTSALRIGVKDNQCAWLDGFFPIAARNLRTLPGVGAALYTASGGLTVVCFAFYNIGATPYMVVFLSDGSAVQVATSTGATTTIMPAGTLVNPSIVTVGTSQWGSQYLIIVSSQPNGYWLWNGTLLFAAGTLGPVVTITNVGAGYSSAPVIVASGGHGSGAAFTANIANGQVTGINVASAGSGYLAGDTVSLNFSGGTSSGSGGTLTAVLSHAAGGSGGTVAIGGPVFTGSYWVFTTASVVTGGSGYSQFAVVSVAPGSNAAYVNAQMALTIVGGIITATHITNGGAYVNSNSPVPTVSDAGGYYVSSVTVNNVGSGYSPSTKVTASGGGSPVAQANLSPVITNGTITSVAVVSGGLYGSNTPPALTVTDTSTTAVATATLMSFAIQGTTVEIYTGHVWVGNGATIYYSAPGSFTDFSGANGGGNFTSSDSYLKVGYSQLLNANGFLWLVGDSSVDYISGVQTSGSPLVTTYTKQNADPQTGSPYPASVELFGQSILMANANGVHIVKGSSADKISEDLDGVWNTVANFGGLQLSSAQAYVFGKKVWMTLSQIVDPVSGLTQNKMFLWHDKQWFATLQDVTLNFIKHQEFNSIITAYGTDGTHIYPLLTSPSTAFQKTAQSRFWDKPGGYVFTKDASRLFAVANYTSTLSPNLIFKIDAVDQVAGASSQTYTITGPTRTGYFVMPPEAIGQAGQLTGLTMQTNAADMSLAAVTMAEELVQYRG
jgi:hypothetical protein